MIARLVLAALLLCAAGTARAVTSLDYMAHMQPIKQAALFVDLTSRTWFSEWLSVGDGGAEWLSPGTGKSTGVEHWSQHDDWLVISYFASGFDFEHPNKFPANCIKAVLQDVPTGRMVELPCSNFGHYYMPFLIPQDPWRIFIWGSVGYPFFWSAQFTPGQSVSNPCYFSGTKTEPAIVQREVWWDSVNGWVEGSGGPAFDPTGKPLMPTINYGIEATLGLGDGVVMRKDLVSGSTMCLYSRWTWG